MDGEAEERTLEKQIIGGNIYGNTDHQRRR